MMGPYWDKLRLLKGTLVVSCQAAQGEPLNSPEHIKALALSALMGGAGGLRLEGEDNIAAVRAATDAPIVGLIKSPTVAPGDRLHQVYITSTFAEARAIAAAGADIIALDATGRPRPDGLGTADIIKRIHQELGRPVWADIATASDGVAAAQFGADVLSTTMAGYTTETYVEPSSGPAMDLLTQLVSATDVPVVLEGRVWTPEEARQGFAAGAFAVVVGSAITRPQLITRRFVDASPNAS